MKGCLLGKPVVPRPQEASQWGHSQGHPADQAPETVKMRELGWFRAPQLLSYPALPEQGKRHPSPYHLCRTGYSSTSA